MKSYINPCHDDVRYGSLAASHQFDGVRLIPKEFMELALNCLPSAHKVIDNNDGMDTGIAAQFVADLVRFDKVLVPYLILLAIQPGH